ncbi:MAG: ParA family protein [Bacteroidaceae bacterium]|nr:ParA family protein [Bacteroidaceae bacterium]
MEKCIIKKAFRMNKIIIFGNQKGGVGKTTLCTMFANYLADRDVPVAVIDCDGQQTIHEKRIGDTKLFADNQPRYSITPFSVSDAESVNALMNNVSKAEGVILFDAPGNLAQQGLVPLFAKSDYIVCPYQFELTSINSTVTFVNFINKIKERLKVKQEAAQLIFVPNRYDQRKGLKNELELWNKTEEIFAEYGTNAPRVKDKASMTRYNTYSNSKEISEEVTPTFDYIYDLIIKSQENGTTI